MSAETYSSANESKATFDDIYNQPDPRDYFETLSDLGYVIPEQARPVFREVFGALRELREREGTSTKVVDLGCSYGINAALLKFGVSMDELEELYLDPGLSDAEPSTVTDRVADWLKRQPVHPFLEIVGLDSAERAVEYATRVGFLDDAVAVDLEEGAPPEDFDERLAKTDAIISTGCVGYVGPRTFEHLLEASGTEPAPWVASFVLRMFPYDRIADRLGEFGLVTEKLEDVTFLQRQFATREEQEEVCERLKTRGIDPTGLEAQGQYHAEFFLSRPPAEVTSLTLDEIADRADLSAAVS
jgi:SAM-dependent methyltransferase